MLGSVFKGFSYRFLPALAHSDYRKLWAAGIFAQASNWSLIVARAALALSITGNAAAAGLVTFGAMIPILFVSPFAGYLADRFDRKNVLIVGYLINVVQNWILATLVLTGTIEFWHLALLAVVNGIARAIQQPASSALLPNLVPKKILFNAIALQQATQQGGKGIGPLLILPVILTGNENWAFVISAWLYVFALLMVMNIKTASRGIIQAKQSIFSGITEGLSFVYKVDALRLIFLLVAFHCALTMAYETLFPIISRDQLGLGSAAGLYKGGAILMIAIGMGSLISSFTLAGMNSAVVRGRLYFTFGILSGISPIFLGLSNNLTLAAIAAFGMGFSQAGFMTVSSVMIQQMVPDAIRGRALAIYNWQMQGLMAGFNLINGVLVETALLTAMKVLSISGLIFNIIMGGSILSTPLRQIYREGQISCEQKTEDCSQ
ncbi:MFS transporter [SAR202 cluster bacterium AC-409-J13_OGT_754m]|nr:MFS transporter [SAR202 cluster bacterium AC-409-J13_OGT_754m]